MMQAWTVILPHFIFAWIARRRCEVIDQRGPVGKIVIPRPGILLLAKEPRP